MIEKKRGGRPARKTRYLNKNKERATWDEQDQRYYMRGEKESVHRRAANEWVPDPWE